MRKTKLWCSIFLTIILTFGAGYGFACSTFLWWPARPTWWPYWFAGSTELPSTRPAGALDAPPRAIGPSVAGSPSYGLPPTPAATQELARQQFIEFSRYIQNVSKDKGGWHSPSTFYLPSHYSGWPGLCETTSVSIDPGPKGFIYAQRLYFVVGSFEQSASPASQIWRENIESNCAARAVSPSWFSVEGNGTDDFDAWKAAKLTDGLVASARSSRLLPFSLECRSFEKSVQCDPRKLLAGVNPALISNVAMTKFTRKGILYIDSVINMDGNPFVKITVTQEMQRNPMSYNEDKTVIKSVRVEKERLPIID